MLKNKLKEIKLYLKIFLVNLLIKMIKIIMMMKNNINISKEEKKMSPIKIIIIIIINNITLIKKIHLSVAIKTISPNIIKSTYNSNAI